MCLSRLRASLGLGWLYVAEPPSGKLSLCLPELVLGKLRRA